MTLEKLISKLSFEPLSDNIEENFDRGLALAFLEELKHWRDNPFLMLKKHCEIKKKCDDCEYNDYCSAHTIVTTPEEWKL